MSNKEKIPFWRDTRVLNILGQTLVLIIVIIIIAVLGNNLFNNFRRLGFSFGFDFISRPTSFAISNPPIKFSPTDPYYRAILVGLINSLKVMFFGIIIATIIGITIGIGRLSDNWLVRKIATVYVETLRNTPLLLQLFFWYFAVFLKLPKIDNPVIVADSIFFTNRGIDIPWFVGSLNTSLGAMFILLAVILTIVFWHKRINTVEKTGKSGQIWLNLIWLNAIASLIIFCLVIDWDFPKLAASSITGGLNLSPEFATLLIGLSVYTAAFIAEVVRAGIQSVSKGQWEAARALGLKPSLVMQLIIFPQALRVMIPPLTSEFLNLAKNSSLAVAIGYNDIYAISNTIANQTGRSVEILLIVMGTYLMINLIISLVMNWFNRSVQLKER